MRILLADDSPSMLHEARQILEPEFDVVGVVYDGDALLNAMDEFKPDVLVLDISMPIRNGLEAVRLLRQVGTQVKIVFLTVHHDQEFVEEAFLVGAMGYVVKPRLASDLVIAVREALKGRTFVSPVLTHSPGQAGY
jgi:DNA-binding NarL/FixJ family response regulator